MFKDNIKNYKESEILPYMEANKVARHSFTDAHRRHETLGSEMKDNITGYQNSMSFMFTSVLLIPKSQGGNVKGASWIWVCVPTEEL